MNNILKITVISMIAMVSFCGCAFMRGVAFESAKPVFIGQQSALKQETDYELAKTALETNIKLLEGLILSYPKDIDLKMWVCEALCAYSLGFVEDNNPDRASKLYMRARQYAIDAVVEKSGFSLDYINNPDLLKQWIDKTNATDLPQLFWLGQSWGSWISINLDKPQALADRIKVQWIMEKVITLDESYYHGGAHIFLGAVLGNLPVMFGGNLEQSKQHFARCFELTDNSFLMAHYYFLKTYCVKAQDKKLFEEYVDKVENFDLDKAPELKLVNTIAKKRTKRLNDLKEDLFFED